VKIDNAFTHGFLDDLGRDAALELMARRPDWAVASISEYDAAFLCGAVRHLRPAKVLEVGVASGWGSCLVMATLRAAGVGRFDYYGVDIAERFFYDERYATGECVGQVLPELLPNYRLTTGCLVADMIDDIGGDIDFAFIDANHMHPWATLDLLAVLPSMRPGAFVALHDLSLCRKEDQLHKNRGPKYLFEGWEDVKVHSVQVPTMIGMIRIGQSPEPMLSVLEDTLYTPWEVPVETPCLERICTLAGAAYGSDWERRFRAAAVAGNTPFSPAAASVASPVDHRSSALAARLGGLFRLRR
jgi:predicted O-methyltransferase YrrM